MKVIIKQYDSSDSGKKLINQYTETNVKKVTVKFGADIRDRYAEDCYMLEIDKQNSSDWSRYYLMPYDEYEIIS